MRRLGILTVVMLTIGILVVGLVGVATRYARAQADDRGATPPPATPTPGPPRQSQAITFTSPGDYTFTVGTWDTFEVNATTPERPYPSITMAGPLPSGVTWHAGDFDGTATLSGTPDAGTGGTYTLIFTAHNNGVGADATQTFTVTVDEAPAITSANGTAFTAGTAGTFTVTAKGYPTPSISITTGTLPSGVTFRKNGDGTATLTGTPDGGMAGAYPLTISAANGVLPDATQSFTLTTVLPAPEESTAPPTPEASTAPPTSEAPTAPPTLEQSTAPTTSQSSSRVLWWLAGLAATGVLVAVITGAVVIRRAGQHRASPRERIRAAPHPDAGTVNLDKPETAPAHTVRLEPHADRGTTYLEDEP